MSVFTSMLCESRLWELSFLLNCYEPVITRHFLCLAIVWNLTSLSLSRISDFKGSWELLTGVSTCLNDLKKLEAEIQYLKNKPNGFFTIVAYMIAYFARSLSYSHKMFMKSITGVKWYEAFSSQHWHCCETSPWPNVMKLLMFVIHKCTK